MITIAGATTTLACRFGADADLVGWLSRPMAGMPTSGAVLVPPLGYEAWTAHRTLRTLADALADAGIAALRYDPAGTGSSAGDTWRPDLLEAWRGSLRAAVDLLRAQGCERIALIGLRLGASLALLEGAALGAHAIVAWLPVDNGRRYARELALLAIRPPDDDPRPGADGATIHGGVPFMAATVKEISSLTLGGLVEPPAPRVLVLDTPRRPVSPALPDALTALGVELSHQMIEGADAMIGVDCEKAVVPVEAVAAVAGWVAAVMPAAAVLPPRPLAAGGSMHWRDGTLGEGEITVGGSGLRGVLGVPNATMVGAHRLPSDVTVFLNPGSEHSVGPGRAWVEYARDLNLAGYGTLRLDLRGWGESPPAPDGSFGVSYDPHTEDDIIGAVADLRARGAERIVLVGLCWSSWMALRAVLRSPVEGVYALNASFAWHRGIAPGQTEEESLRENAGLYARVRLGERLHVWPVLDILGLHSHNTRWLDQLGRTGVPIRLAFAEGDIGLTYLRQRLPRPLQRLIDGGTVSLVEIPGIDHQMHREWLRPAVSADLVSFVSSVAAGTAAVQS